MNPLRLQGCLCSFSRTNEDVEPHSLIITLNLVIVYPQLEHELAIPSLRIIFVFGLIPDISFPTPLRVFLHIAE